MLVVEEIIGSGRSLSDVPKLVVLVVEKVIGSLVVLVVGEVGGSGTSACDVPD